MSANYWIGLVLQTVAAVAGVPDEESSSAVLRTVEGQSMRGVLVPSAPGSLGLLSEDFTEPLTIRPDRVDSIELDVARDAPDRAPALLELRLVDGGRLHARVLERSPESWHVEIEGMGTHRLPASLVGGETYLGGDEADQEGLIYSGPTGLSGWTQDGKGAAWVAQPGRLVADAASARVTRDFGLGDGRVVYAKLKWAGTPRFRMLLGCAAKGKRSATVTVECWGGSLVAWNTHRKNTSYLELAQGLLRDSELTVGFALAPEETLFFGSEGQEIGRLPHAKVMGSHLALQSDGGRLEFGELTVAARGDESLRGARSFDVIPLDEAPSAAVPAGHMHLVYADGRRISGAFVQVGINGIELQPAWANSPWTCSLTGLRFIRMQRGQSSKRRARPSKSFLVASKGEVAGELEAIRPNGDVVWRPTISMASATLRTESIQRVVINRTTAYYVSSRKFPHLMRLRSGDTFRCAVRGMSEDSLTFDSTFSEGLTVDASLVKAIEFDVRSMRRFAKIFAEKDEPGGGWSMARESRRETSEGFDAKSLERALALPRKYKARRFEHLVLARNGDFLRTNLMGLSPDGATYPGRGDAPRVVPRERLAAVVWLNPTEVKDPVEPTEGVTARIVLDEETSLSVVLSGAGEGRLRGTSPVLGEVVVDLTSVLSIELDAASNQSKSVYADWVLRPMKEPFPDEAPAPAK